MVLRRALANLLQCLRMVLRHALAILIHGTEFALGMYIVLRSALANYFTASAWSCGTPTTPLLYTYPRSHTASAKPTATDSPFVAIF